jgi:hypothetical protein
MRRLGVQVKSGVRSQHFTIPFFGQGFVIYPFSMIAAPVVEASA